MYQATRWDNRFMSFAKDIADWSSCLRRKVGCVTVKDKRMLTTGYNGAPSSIKSCVERNECIRDKNNIASGENIEMCYAVHAEQNAIAQAAKLGVRLEGAYLYCTHLPCSSCAKLIINSGIKKVFYSEEYADTFGKKLLNDANVEVIKI